MVKDRPLVELVDLAAFGRPARLVWRKHRWARSDPTCPIGMWTGQEPRIAAARLADRARRWVTFQVGKHGRTVAEVISDLGCGWYTVNDAVIAYGTALVDDEGRIGDIEALGFDETLFCRVGRWRRQVWSTQIADVSGGRLLDVVEGRTAVGPAAWLAARGEQWCSQIRWATLDLSGPYRSAFDTMLPAAIQVADLEHVVKLANTKVDETRRRVLNETMGHRGRKNDPLYHIGRLLTKADERLTDKDRHQRHGRVQLDAGDPQGEARTAWHAKEVVRQIHTHTDPEHVAAVDRDVPDNSCPPEVRSLGRTIIRRKDQIAAWHQAHVSNGTTEAADDPIKRIKRVAFRFRRFRKYLIRTPLYAARPNWDLLATITPR